jgi:hypothetical protein
MPTRRPQILQQEIHSRPQAVDKFVTLRDCPHRYPQKLSTSVRSGRPSFPPLGTKPVETCGLVWKTLARNGAVPTLTFQVEDERVTKDLDANFRPGSQRTAVHNGPTGGQRCGQPRPSAFAGRWPRFRSASDLGVFTGFGPRVTHSAVESARRDPVENLGFGRPGRSTMGRVGRGAMHSRSRGLGTDELETLGRELDPRVVHKLNRCASGPREAGAPCARSRTRACRVSGVQRLGSSAFSVGRRFPCSTLAGSPTLSVRQIRQAARPISCRQPGC